MIPSSAFLLAATLAANGAFPQPATAYDFSKLQREKLGRGVVAFRSGEREAVVTWRYRMQDPTNLAFNVYRDGRRLNAQPLAGATFYRDETFNPSKGGLYSVRPVLGRRESTNPARGWRVPSSAPHGYNHLCTTPPAFMWYELVAKCWENGVRDVWMVNAGDVFQAEVLLGAYGKFAANPEAWKNKADPQREAIESWVSEEFLGHKKRKGHNAGECLREPCGLCGKISAHLAEYYNLGFNRKPEHMCIQWTTNLPAAVKSSLLKRFHALLKEDGELEKLFTNFNCHSCSQIAKDDYFRLIGFQVRFLAHAGIIHLEGRDKAYARSVIDPLYERWDRMDGGKWAGFWCDTIDEHGGLRQPTTHNRWSSQMQWPWNEPADPAKKDRHGRSRNDYAATVYRADIAEPTWIEPVKRERGTGNGEWKEVPGLGTSGNALALLPVKPGVGAGATLEYDLNMRRETRDASIPRSPFPVPRSLILQFLPDFALWPGLKLGVNVVFNGYEPKFVEVPCSNSNLGEHDRIRNQAVQDNFIRVEIPVPAGAKSFKIVAKDPGVVIDRIGIRK